MRYLLSKGAAVNLAAPENCSDPSPILVANGLEVHRLLLHAGADPNVDVETADYWARPIARAVIGCQHKLIDLLVSHKAIFDERLKQEYAQNCPK